MDNASRRAERFVGRVTPATRILEIGALHRPTIRENHYNVKYADFADASGLREIYSKYPDFNLNAIVNVDFVIADGDYRSSIGEERFDLILASHVGEHMPDFVGWLQEMFAILADGGTLSMILPDKRFTFDLIRSDTSIGDLLTAHVAQLKKPSMQQIYNHVRAHTPLQNLNLWSPPAKAVTLKRIHDDQQSWEISRAHWQCKSYFDVHCSILTPSSFYTNLCRLDEVGLMPFELEAMYDTNPNEIDFQVRLRRPAPGEKAQMRDFLFEARKGTPYRLVVSDETVVVSAEAFWSMQQSTTISSKMLGRLASFARRR